MSTELVAYEKNQFLALAEGSEIREAIEANIATGETIEVSDLTRIPTPAGGATTWQWEGVAGEETAKEIVGLLVYLQPRGVLWPYEEPSDEPPVLVTYDLIKAHRVGDNLGDVDLAVLDEHRNEDGSYDWQALPYNAFGSSSKGEGKRCKESRMLFVLREGDAWPLIVNAGPGSLKTIRPWIKKLTVPHWRAIVSLSLQKVKNAGGQDYSQIVPRLAGTIDREAGDVVRKLYTTPLSQVATRIPVRQED